MSWREFTIPPEPEIKDGNGRVIKPSIPSRKVLINLDRCDGILQPESNDDCARVLFHGKTLPVLEEYGAIEEKVLR